MAKKTIQQLLAEHRGEATREQKQAMYNTHRWRTYAKGYLEEHPLCVEHGKRGKLVPSEVLDHIKPHCGDERLFWMASNHQALCKACHDTKSLIGGV